MKNKNLIIYDFLAAVGGAEKVLFFLQSWLQSKAMVGYVDKKIFSNEEVLDNIYELKKSSEKFSKNIFSVCISFLNLNVDSYCTGVRIFSGSYAPLSLLKSKSGKNIYYCHTPPRFLYDLRGHYLKEFGIFQKIIFIIFCIWFKPKYEESIKKMHVVISNSLNVKKRLKKYLNVDSVVIYPPVAIKKFRWISDGDYFLSTARLESLKRVDLIIKAFKDSPEKKLLITSTGRDENLLRSLAKDCPNIKFVGLVDDSELINLIGNCLATIYIPKDEDFGISPVESMAAGKPVIGVSEGGVLETVIDEETGFLLPKNFNHHHLSKIIKNFDKSKALAMRSACEKRALIFSEENFKKSIQDLCFNLD